MFSLEVVTIQLLLETSCSSNLYRIAKEIWKNVEKMNRIIVAIFSDQLIKPGNANWH